MSSISPVITLIRPSFDNNYLEYAEYDDYVTAVDEISAWCVEHGIPCDREVYGILRIKNGEVTTLPLNIFIDSVGETIEELTSNLES